MQRLIFLDTETTGLRVEDGNRLVEIGAVEAHDREIIAHGRSGHFQRYLNPERPCEIGAFNVHQLSDDFLAQQATFAQVVDDFLDYIQDDTLVIHNASFDLGFINAELKKLKRPALENPVIDSLKIARGVLSELGSHNLDRLCDHFQIDRSHRVAHGALLDAHLLAEVYLLMTRSQGGLDLQSFDHLNYGAKIAPFRQADGSLPLRPTAINTTARQKHQELLSSFKMPNFWRENNPANG